MGPAELDKALCHGCDYSTKSSVTEDENVYCQNPFLFPNMRDFKIGPDLTLREVYKTVGLTGKLADMGMPSGICYRPRKTKHIELHSVWTKPLR